MKVNYTTHARTKASEERISREEITHILRYGRKERGQGNKTLLVDTMRNLCVIAVSQSKTRWLVITAYRIANQS